MRVVDMLEVGAIHRHVLLSALPLAQACLPFFPKRCEGILSESTLRAAAVAGLQRQVGHGPWPRRWRRGESPFDAGKTKFLHIGELTTPTAGGQWSIFIQTAHAPPPCGAAAQETQRHPHA